MLFLDHSVKGIKEGNNYFWEMTGEPLNIGVDEVLIMHRNDNSKELLQVLIYLLTKIGSNK